MESLYVIYDGYCGFCQRVRGWPEFQPKHVNLLFVARQSPLLGRLWPELVGSFKDDELVVIGDNRGVYRGTAAYVMCLWALKRHRRWAYRLANPVIRPLVRMAVEQLASHRQDLSHWFGFSADGDMDENRVRALVASMGQQEGAGPTCAAGCS